MIALGEDKAPAGDLLPRGRLRLVAVPIAIGLAVYVGLFLWGGVGDVGHAFARIGPAALAGALGLATINFLLRFLRWQMYLARLGHPIPRGRSFRIYLSGFALTISPGKLGENVRAPLLKRLGVPYRKSLSAFLNERLSDIAALLLMSLIGISAYPRVAWIALVVGAVLAVAMALLVLEGRLAAVAPASSLPGKAMAALRRVFDAARSCHSPGLTAASLLLSLGAWSAEAFVLALIVPRFGLDLPIAFTLFAFAIAILAGAISFVPAGLGGTEAVMALMLAGRGLPMPDAIAAAMVLRLTTLWFAVLVGACALQWELVAFRRDGRSAIPAVSG